MPELWNLYDRFKMPLGRTQIRGEKLNDGEFIDFTYNRIKGIFPEIFGEGMTID